jgi:hypothetical protein
MDISVNLRVSVAVLKKNLVLDQRGRPVTGMGFY